MELYQLKTFVKVADEGNLTRAAELLFTSQPAISAQIKALEEELGVALFQRSSRGMELTAKGRLLYEQAAETLDAAARLKQEAQLLQQELVGDLHIGVHTDFRFMRIGGLHRALQGRHPRISPHFTASMSAQILPDIHRGVLDAGFFYGRCNIANLAVTTLLDVPMRVVGPIDWEDRVRTASIDELADMPWVYTSDTCPFFSVSQQLFAPHGITVPKRVAYTDSEDAVRELVRAGAGLSLLRADDAESLVADRTGCCWPGESPSVQAGFAVRRQRAGEPLIRALTEVVDELWFDSQDSADRAEA